MREEAFADAATLDQLRVLVAVVETGSFTGAARELRRVQGAISYNIAKLEDLLGTKLFDRTGRRPTLTRAGAAIASQARDVLAEMDRLRSTARGMSVGLESDLVVGVDTLYPVEILAVLLREFQGEFPTIGLSIHTGVLAEVVDWVADGVCDMGITGMSHVPETLAQRPCGHIEMIAVAAKEHPLAREQAPIEDASLGRHVHIVMTDRRTPREEDGETLGFLSTRRWYVNDMHTRHQMLRAGLGWSRMPHHLVAGDLEEGVLVRLRVARWGDRRAVASLVCVHRKQSPLGPGGQWFSQRMETLDAKMPT